jgi:hypothetical protein
VEDYDSFTVGLKITCPSGATWYIADRFDARGRHWVRLTRSGRPRVVSVEALVALSLFGYVEIME